MSTHPRPLQSLVDDASVANVLLTGDTTVCSETGDGSRVRAAPVADSDLQLLAQLTSLASQA